MKKKFVKIIVFLSVIVALYFANVEVQTYFGKKALAESGLTSTDFQEAMKLMATTDKPVLLEMSAIWCPNCRRLDRKVFSEPSVRDNIQKNFIFSRVEYESPIAETIREKTKVSGFPTVMIYPGPGREPIILPSTFNPNEFTSLLTPFIGKSDEGT